MVPTKRTGHDQKQTTYESSGRLGTCLSRRHRSVAGGEGPRALLAGPVLRSCGVNVMTSVAT